MGIGNTHTILVLVFLIVSSTLIWGWFQRRKLARQRWLLDFREVADLFFLSYRLEELKRASNHTELSIDMLNPVVEDVIQYLQDRKMTRTIPENWKAILQQHLKYIEQHYPLVKTMPKSLNLLNHPSLTILTNSRVMLN